nr:hypothetical protein Q903MT_gene2003 [Picea sitchensis]
MFLTQLGKGYTYSYFLYPPSYTLLLSIHTSTLLLPTYTYSSHLLLLSPKAHNQAMTSN